MNETQIARAWTAALSPEAYEAHKKQVLADSSKSVRNAEPLQDAARIARDALLIAPATESTSSVASTPNGAPGVALDSRKQSDAEYAVTKAAFLRRG